MALRQGNGEGIKYEVRSTKYEVKELGATELRGWVERKRSRESAWGINRRTREAEAHLVRRASATRIGISIAASSESCLGTGVSPPLHRTHHSLPLSPILPHPSLPGFGTSYFVPRTSPRLPSHRMYGVGRARTVGHTRGRIRT